ncbi:hypothetical protein MBENS4_2878 [Novosphingobium sp. MBES04]|nr:hypothetical protein MBENS4_2878 [Novosphingobium sp. MBES04]
MVQYSLRPAFRAVAQVAVVGSAGFGELPYKRIVRMQFRDACSELVISAVSSASPNPASAISGPTSARALAMTGRPEPIASSATRPNGSDHRLGMTATRASAMACATPSRSSRPRKRAPG